MKCLTKALAIPTRSLWLNTQTFIPHVLLIRQNTISGAALMSEETDWVKIWVLEKRLYFAGKHSYQHNRMTVISKFPNCDKCPRKYIPHVVYLAPLVVCTFTQLGMLPHLLSKYGYPGLCDIQLHKQKCKIAEHERHISKAYNIICHKLLTL